jgi:hypothetical protein
MNCTAAMLQLVSRLFRAECRVGRPVSSGETEIAPRRSAVLIHRILIFFLVCGALLTAEDARALTRLPTTTYSTDTTWYYSQSPYILDGNVTVAAGATLTIEPGVTVKFNGQFRMITVKGTIKAVGTQSSRITFTSLQDDSINGDSGGDGYTYGQPGQWYQILINSSSSLSEFKYVDVRYGGYGSADWNYGAIVVGGSASIAIDRSTLSNNNRSGLKVGTGCTNCYPGATVTRSTIVENGNGVSVNGAWVSIGANSEIADNRTDGVWFNLTSSYAGPGSTIMDSDVTRNGEIGININAASSLPASRIPSGNRSNIHENDLKELRHTTYRPGVDWTGNFWGDFVGFEENPGVCLDAYPNAPGHLDYGDTTAVDGPITWAQYVGGSGNNAALCTYDHFRILASQFSPTYIGHGGDAGSGSGGFDASYYSYGDPDCTQRSDPVTVVFYGDATVESAMEHVEHHTDWSAPTPFGATQYFSSNGYCGIQEDERAENIVTSRYHIRGAQTAATDPELGTTTLGTAHFEDLVTCDGEPRHAIRENGPDGSGFDWGRNEIYGAFSELYSDHYPYLQYKGNTASIQQCDLQWASSNGYVLFAVIP